MAVLKKRVTMKPSAEKAKHSNGKQNVKKPEEKVKPSPLKKKVVGNIPKEPVKPSVSEESTSVPSITEERTIGVDMANEPDKTVYRRAYLSRKEMLTYEGQLTYADMIKLLYKEKKALWKHLNTVKGGAFVTILLPAELPKTYKKLTPDDVSNKPAKDALYCPYCAEWMPFETFSYTGYDKCTGCGISTQDFHTRKANKLW